MLKLCDLVVVVLLLPTALAAVNALPDGYSSPSASHQHPCHHLSSQKSTSTPTTVTHTFSVFQFCSWLTFFSAKRKFPNARDNFKAPQLLQDEYDFSVSKKISDEVGPTFFSSRGFIPKRGQDASHNSKDKISQSPTRRSSSRQQKYTSRAITGYSKTPRDQTLTKVVEEVVLENVTTDVGIYQQKLSLKFGGPFIGDINNDGTYDLLLSFHNGIRTRMYFGEESGNFTLAEFVPVRKDIHGITAAHRTAHSLQAILAISVGGGNGTNLKETEFYSISPDRTITNVSYSDGLGQRATRGRNILFMDLALRKKWERRKNKGGPDMVVTSFLGSANSGIVQFAYENVRGKFKLQELPGFQYEVRGRVAVTDVNGDGIMELINIRSLEIFKLIAPFTFEKANQYYLPPDFEVPYLSVNAVAEIDYDNDGDFDLYVARANRTLMTNRGEIEDDDLSDYLLENRDGRYIDVSENAGIPTGSNSMGVTTGDFNNDGYVDIVVIKYKEPDVLLLNNGDGTFQQVDGLIPKDADTVGNHAVAVDYDFDGRVDVVVGHGDVDTIGGPYLVMKGQLQLTENSRYLLVTVANDPTRGATAIHAVVTVFVAGQRLTRRIGSPGTQGGGESYLTTVHFGIGSFSKVECVRVQWTNGVKRKVVDVAADQRITFGVE